MNWYQPFAAIGALVVVVCLAVGAYTIIGRLLGGKCPWH